MRIGAAIRGMPRIRSAKTPRRMGGAPLAASPVGLLIEVPAFAGTAPRGRRFRFAQPILRCEPRAVVRRGEIERGAERHDAGRVDLAMAAVIMPLDMVDANRPGDAVDLIRIARLIAQVRRIP